MTPSTATGRWIVAAIGDMWIGDERATQVTFSVAFLEERILAIEAEARAEALAAVRAAVEAEFLAKSFIHIRGAHNPTPDELDLDEEVRPCAWCRLAGEQASEAVLAAIDKVADTP